MSKQIALVGQQLIHTYPYLVHFNGSDREKIKKNAKPWMQEFMLDRDMSAKTGDARVTRIWSPDAEEVSRLVETFGIGKVCASAEEALDGADGAMVMDEIIDSRTALVEKSIQSGCSVFADKILSDNPGKTEELLVLAEEKNVRVQSWSQMGFNPGLQNVRAAPAGGAGFLNFKLGLDILPMYGIHVISMLHGAFAGRMHSYRPLSDNGNREGLLQFDDGTNVFLHIGPDVPFLGRLYYCANDAEVIVNQNDLGACFEQAALALIDLFSGKPQAAGPGPTEMREASVLLEHLVHGGSDGNNISLLTESRG